MSEDLPLQESHYADAGFCAPVEEWFQVWLRSVPLHEATNRKRSSQ